MHSPRSNSPSIRGHRLVPLVLAGLCALAGCRLETRGASLPSETGAPDFELTAHTGERVSLGTLLSRGPALVVFYRGYW